MLFVVAEQTDDRYWMGKNQYFWGPSVSLRFRAPALSLVCLLAICARITVAQHAANSNAIYQQLRSLTTTDDVIAVNNVEIHRSTATFTFRSGNIAFYAPVNGKITGAVFVGQGHFHLTAPDAAEQHHLAVLNQDDTYDEDFDQVVLRFTDETSAELHKDAAGKGELNHAYDAAARDLHTFHEHKLTENLDLRLLEDVLSPTQGGFFLAAMHSKKDPHLIFRIDPHGATDVAPQQVSLLNWNEWGESYPVAFSLRPAGKDDEHVGDGEIASYKIDSEDLDTTIEKGGFLTGSASVHITALEDGLAVVPLTLYPTLRVSSVTMDKGDALDFVQEDKDLDADFGVILSSPLKKGDSFTLHVAYSGKKVVEDEGGANYYPIARQSWYPNTTGHLGNFAAYHMLFHVPKGLQLIATGTKVGEKTEGKITTTEWKTDVPLAVVGFNLGKFTMKEATVEDKQGDKLTIDAYANTTPPDELANLNSATMGTFNATSMLPMQLSQGVVAAKLYTAFFGAIPFTRVALTQQFACDYGQSWPMLVYLPICGFLDTTQQHELGLQPNDMYWRVVTPHEMAHQWWGQTVGFRSYRDQWMSEGFADDSAAIFLEVTSPKPDNFRDFWKQERALLTEKNAQGFRPIDVGPVTMGFRLSTDKTGWNIYRNLVYPKGAYILHMIRLMMWTPREGDGPFIAMMHDFLNTYRLRAATTEDFKTIVEKHMTPEMDLDHDHTMDWFFNEYVYGTALPQYHFGSDVTPNGDGTRLHIKLTQSGVPADFKMIVPVYLEFTNGKVIRLGSAAIKGPTTMEQTINLPKTPVAVKGALINYYYDVLSTEN